MQAAVESGDRLRAVVCNTATQVADALTKSMKSRQLFRMMRAAKVQLSDLDKKLKKAEVNHEPQKHVGVRGNFARKKAS